MKEVSKDLIERIQEASVMEDWVKKKMEADLGTAEPSRQPKDIGQYGLRMILA